MIPNMTSDCPHCKKTLSGTNFLNTKIDLSAKATKALSNYPLLFEIISMQIWKNSKTENIKESKALQICSKRCMLYLR